MRKLHSCLSLFERDVGQVSANRSSGQAVDEAKWRLQLWGSQVELAEEFEKGLALSRASIAGSSNLFDQEVLFLESSDPADSTLLAPYSQETNVVEEGEESVQGKSSQPASSAYRELLNVIAHATPRLDLA